MAKVTQNISGGTHNHLYFPHQTELDLESKSEGVSIKLRPSQKKRLEKLAKERGQDLSTMCRRMIFRHLDIEPELHKLYAILDKSLT